MQPERSFAPDESFAPVEDDALELANGVYARIDFLLSDPAHDETWGLVVDGRPVALGRLTRHADGALEIGGFWVDPAHRRRGLARRLVAAVIARVPPGERCFCLPFDHLVEFYSSFGMTPVDCGEELPPSIQAKRRHCVEMEGRGSYVKTTLLELRGGEGEG